MSVRFRKTRKKNKEESENSKSKKKEEGSYEVSLYYEDEYGIRNRYVKGGFKTKTAAQNHEKIMAAKFLQGPYLKIAKKTFSEVWEEYLKVEGNQVLSPGTLTIYVSAYNKHVKPTIGNLPITSFNYVNLQTYFNEQSGKGKSVVARIVSICNHVFKFSIKCRYIDTNPMVNVEARGKETEKEQTALTFEELEKLVHALSHIREYEITSHAEQFTYYSYCIALYLGYYLGLRVGESVALKKSAFDFENDTVEVNSKLEYHNLAHKDMHLTNRMKTKSSKAKLPICKPLKEILLQWFDYNPYDLVCCNKSGGYIDPAYMQKRIKKLGETMGINFHTHMCRYAFVTNLINNDINIKTVSKLSRHKRIQTTLDVYAKVDDGMMKTAIDKTFDKKRFEAE